MASNIFTRTNVSGDVTEYSRKGTQGRKKVFGDKFGQRLFIGDKEKITAMGYEVNDFVRLATHKLIIELVNNGDTELVKT
jgi:hypothetical protein